ncbi:MAG: hypothetical protein JXA10_04900 [Anaerolineae bacterium]|nr:hypothetical protein [Anaerolineae bacterium]
MPRQRTVSILKQFVSGALTIALLTALMISALGNAAPAAAQGETQTLLVWYTLDNVGPVIERVSANFEAAFGATVDVQYVRPQQLFDLMAKNSGGGPDVIFASSDDVGPLIDNRLVFTGIGSRIFLADVLEHLPKLIIEMCADEAAASCLWPRVAPGLITAQPTDQLTSRAENWLCSSADWMCADNTTSGEPLSWWFNIYLIDEAWLAENGYYLPADVTGLDELRSDAGLDYEWAEAGALPLADTADSATVYIFPSALLVQDPQGLMRSLDSFNQQGYLPVLEIGIDSLFVSVNSANTGLAQDYIDFVAGDPLTKVDLMTEADLLPALDAVAMQTLGEDSTGTLAMLRAATMLTAYTELVY